ncbi:MAG: hypothetical protein ABEJ93_00680 [Candidatus Nanohalobium sp.]
MGEEGLEGDLADSVQEDLSNQVFNDLSSFFEDVDPDNVLENSLWSSYDLNQAEYVLRFLVEFEDPERGSENSLKLPNGGICSTFTVPELKNYAEEFGYDFEFDGVFERLGHVLEGISTVTPEEYLSESDMSKSARYNTGLSEKYVAPLTNVVEEFSEEDIEDERKYVCSS